MSRNAAVSSVHLFPPAPTPTPMTMADTAASAFTPADVKILGGTEGRLATPEEHPWGAYRIV